MKDYEPTQLSYLAMALVSSKPDQWAAFFADALESYGEEHSKEYINVIDKLINVSNSHSIDDLIKELKSSKDIDQKRMSNIIDWHNTSSPKKRKIIQSITITADEFFKDPKEALRRVEEFGKKVIEEKNI